MHVYSAMVRPGGLQLNEVPKTDLTSAEIVLLRKIHGNDAVIKIQWTKSDRRSHGAERERLTGIYGEKAFAETFGAGYDIKLPNELPDVEAGEEEEVEEIVMDEESGKPVDDQDDEEVVKDEPVGKKKKAA